MLLVFSINRVKLVIRKPKTTNKLDRGARTQQGDHKTETNRLPKQWPFSCLIHYFSIRNTSRPLHLSMHTTTLFYCTVSLQLKIKCFGCVDGDQQ